MTDDLIKRARYCQEYGLFGAMKVDGQAVSFGELADALEAQAAEIARLREVLVVLRDLPIVENDNPDTLHLKGEAHTGPVVDYLFHVVRKIKEVARAALEAKP